MTDKPLEALKRLFYPASQKKDLSERPAVIQATAEPNKEHDKVFSYSDFEKKAESCRKSLADKGVKKGDLVVVMAPNSPELAACILAIWRLGAVAVPIDFRITREEVVNVCQGLNARAITVASSLMEAASDAFGNGHSSITLLNLSDACAQEVTSPVLDDAESVDSNGPALIILTSGTTGKPKGAVHDLSTLIINLIELGELVHLNPETRGLLPLPLSHIFGLEVFFASMLNGCCVVFGDLSPQGFVACIAKYRPHIIGGVPTIYGALLGVPDGAIDLSDAQVLLCGGAPLPLSLAHDFEKKFGKRINNGYGSTESKIIALNLDGPTESVGKLVPSTRVDIVNASDEPLPEGEVGEIRIAGPILMKGYLDNPEATKAVLHDGHYHTGDLGYVKDGYVFISGRAKEMIIVAGNKVFPSEVEDVLRKHPLVKEIAIIGLPHKQLGQIVKAFIVVTDGSESKLLDGDADQKKQGRQELLAIFKDYCKDNLKRELRPMDWEFRSSGNPLPKTAAGKVDKKQLQPVAV